MNADHYFLPIFQFPISHSPFPVLVIYHLSPEGEEISAVLTPASGHC